MTIRVAVFDAYGTLFYVAAAARRAATTPEGAGLGPKWQALAATSEAGGLGPGTWSWSAMSAGVGCVVGFFVGAALRHFVRLGLIAVLVLTVLLVGSSALGWIELPWGSVSETGEALGRELAKQTAGLRAALTGLLPSSTMTGLGMFAGVTQKPLEPEAHEPRRQAEDANDG